LGGELGKKKKWGDCDSYKGFVWEKNILRKKLLKLPDLNYRF
jgi:hypothetical protein